MEEKSKEKKSRKDYWLHEGIVVKVITKKLGDKYHKKKAVVKVSSFNWALSLCPLFLHSALADKSLSFCSMFLTNSVQL